MDTSPSDDSMGVMSVMMKPWLHFTGGDYLYFSTVAPSSHGAITGAAIVLFVIALLDRFVFAIRGVMGQRWKKR